MPGKSASHRSGRRSTRKKTRVGAGAGRRSAGSKQRLQKLLASAGFGSRRQCEELIEAGRVDVDGQIVTRLGTTVDPDVNKVRVDGDLLKKQKLVYYAVNKPIGFVTTNRDPQGRPRVVDLVPPDERVFPVGRLDRNSEGLILLTNDGELAQQLTHPRFGVRKVYRVTVAGKVDSETMKHMRKGIYIAEGFVRVEGARLLKSRSRSTEMEIVLREGKNREIRRILARLGHKVQHLRRIAVGPLRLGDLPPGAYRVVSHHEVDKLWRATETSTDAGPPRRRGKVASRRAAGPSSRRPIKKPRDSQRGTPSDASPDRFALDAAPTTGSVIGADPEPSSSRTAKRARKSAKGKRRVGPAIKHGTSGRSGRGRNETSRSTAAKRGQRKRTHAKRKRKN